MGRDLMNNSIDKPSQFAGFWRRLFAFFLDILFLGIVGAILGVFLHDYFASIGGWGRLIGFTIALPYFGVMNSQICSGQTLGKMAMKIKVVSGNGKPLSIAAAFCRSSIICVPYFLNGAPFDAELINSWLGDILVFLVFGVGLSILYLFLFNRKTRRSLHDLAVGSYVVRTGNEAYPILNNALWRGHFAVVVGLMAIVAVVPIFTLQLAKKEPFASLVSLQKGLSSQHGVRYVSVTAGTSSFASLQNGSHSTTSLSIHAVTDSKDIDQIDLANKIAQFVLGNNAETNKKDIVAVSISYGYDIGISSMWRTQNFVFSPKQWRERLAPKFNTNV